MQQKNSSPVIFFRFPRHINGLRRKRNEICALVANRAFATVPSRKRAEPSQAEPPCQPTQAEHPMIAYAQCAHTCATGSAGSVPAHRQRVALASPAPSNRIAHRHTDS
jgi:hypothetical protein